MDTFTVSFFGHRQLEEPLKIEKRLEQVIQMLLNEKQYVELLVGRDGEYDKLVSAVIRRCKRTVRDDNSSHVWVLPYETSEFRSNEESFREYYDEIEISREAPGGYFKSAHQTRNREMVDRSHLVVFCIQHESGGAWQTMKYAKKQGVSHINLAYDLEDERR